MLAVTDSGLRDHASLKFVPQRIEWGAQPSCDTPSEPGVWQVWVRTGLGAFHAPYEPFEERSLGREVKMES